MTTDISKPRHLVLRRFRGEPGSCPRCGSRLVNSYQTYMVATRRGKQISDSFIVGSDFGWFCQNCPTVVINQDDLDKQLSAGAVRFNVGEQYAVLGIVDFDAVPANKRSAQLGTDDNPIPLVEFLREGGSDRPRPKSKARRR